MEHQQRREKNEKQLRGETKNSKTGNADAKTVQLLRRSNELDKMKEDRAKRNIFESRSASIEEKQKRRLEDLALTTLDIRNEINNNKSAVIPLEYKLNQNYPNPFNPVTRISFSIPKQGQVTLKVYDVLGKEVMTLVNEVKSAGTYEVVFNGSNLVSGAYFYKIESGDFSNIKRMILLK